LVNSDEAAGEHREDDAGRHGSAFIYNERDGQPPPFSLIELKLSAKGGDPAEWPEDLRVREMPATVS
jgi:hypothetical protein